MVRYSVGSYLLPTAYHDLSLIAEPSGRYLLARDLGARGGVSDHLDVSPVVACAILPERGELRIGSLLVGRDPCINNDSLLHAFRYAGFAQNNCLVCD